MRFDVFCESLSDVSSLLCSISRTCVRLLLFLCPGSFAITLEVVGCQPTYNVKDSYGGALC